MRVGLDIDGVLANFVDAHTALIKDQLGVELPAFSTEWPTVWDYDKETLGEEKAVAVFKTIEESFNFWMKLQPLDENLLKLLASVETSHQFYFITSRPGESAKFQTEAWLLKWFNLPTVLIARDKAPIVKALGLELFVDDLPPTNNAVVDATDGKCLTLMPDRPWNRTTIMDARVTRVKNLTKALGPILGWDLEKTPLGRLVA